MGWFIKLSYLWSQNHENAIWKGFCFFVFIYFSGQRVFFSPQLKNKQKAFTSKHHCVRIQQALYVHFRYMVSLSFSVIHNELKSREFNEIGAVSFFYVSAFTNSVKSGLWMVCDHNSKLNSIITFYPSAVKGWWVIVITLTDHQRSAWTWHD